jgi:hypothetical protein
VADHTVSAACHLQCGAQRGAGVPGGRLHPDGVEWSLLQQARVGHAVEGHATGHAEVAVAGALVQPAGQVEDHLLESPLHAGGEVGVHRRPLASGLDARREGCPVDGLDVEAAVLGGAHQLAHAAEEDGLAVRGHGHHLVLVAAAQEAEVFGDLLVHESQRVGELLLRQHLQLAAPAAPGKV